MSHSDELKVFWFNPIRAATRSTGFVQDFFKFKNSRQHHLPTEKQKDYYLISNIRNPYSRFVSIFYFVFGKENRTIEDFPMFLKKKIHEEKSNLVGTLDLQINLTKIYERIGKFPDKLIKVENLYDDIKSLYFVSDNSDSKLFEIMEQNIKTNRFFQEYGSKPDWKKHYDEETANILYDYLKNDFELGNYDKNSWKDGTS